VTADQICDREESPGWADVGCGTVPAWKVIEEAEPDFAERVRRLFDAGRHKTIATLRADGSPRISGIECEFAGGDLRFGSMSGARKGADLQRDPRFALHGPTFHPEEGKESNWPGEAKIAGRAFPVGPVSTDETSDNPTVRCSSPISPRS
jgi:Pyridoxamine 5'-phosphate oxidase